MGFGGSWKLRNFFFTGDNPNFFLYTSYGNHLKQYFEKRMTLQIGFLPLPRSFTLHILLHGEIITGQLFSKVPTKCHFGWLQKMFPRKHIA